MAGFENFTEDLMKGSNARGLAVSVFHRDGSILYEKFFGCRDEASGAPIDEDTFFGIASVSKSFTTLAILQLAEQGIISLDDPVAKYVTEYNDRNRTEPVRIWHLLCHSGGYFPLPRILLSNVAKEMGIHEDPDNEYAVRTDLAEEGIRRVAGRLADQTRFVGRPGELMSYCNDGFAVLSDIIRRKGGCRSYAEYLEEHVFKPLGMTRTTVSFLRPAQDPNTATLYTLEKGQWTADHNYENDAFVLHGGGGLKSTLADLRKYLLMYLNDGRAADGTRLLSSHLLREMRKPRQHVKPGVSYAYGLEVFWMGDAQCVCHGGSLPGVSSNVAWSPEGEIGVIVLCNTMDVPVYAVSDAIMRLYLGLPMLEERQEHTPCEWPEAFKAEIVGDYISGEGDRFRLEYDENGGIRMFDEDKKVEMMPIYRDEGLVRRKYSDTYVQFLMDEDGHVYAARYGSRVFPKNVTEGRRS